MTTKTIKKNEGDIVRVRETGFVGRLNRLAEAERCGGGRWLVVAKTGTAQPKGGLRDCELVCKKGQGE